MTRNIKPYLVRVPKVLWVERTKKQRLFEFFGFVLMALVLVQLIVWTPPSTFPDLTTIKIKKGTTLNEAAIQLNTAGYIKSPLSFKVFVTLFGGSTGVVAGDYFFAKTQSVMPIAWRIVKGEYGLVPLRITVPEGMSVIQIADLFHKQFTLFDEDEFVALSREGYMFPDTYFFLPNVSAQEVIDTMVDNFNVQIRPLQADILLSGRSFEDIITMASIVQEEAHNEEEQKMIAGILWNRIRIKMPLQVDVTFQYINGKNTYTLTKQDLKIDSPYNTYVHKGLPPTPISNPGLAAIKATITPTPSDFYYFLADLSGKTYYAKDFKEHQENREKYLRR